MPLNRSIVLFLWLVSPTTAMMLPDLRGSDADDLYSALPTQTLRRVSWGIGAGAAMVLQESCWPTGMKTISVEWVTQTGGREIYLYLGGLRGLKVADVYLGHNGASWSVGVGPGQATARGMSGTKEGAIAAVEAYLHIAPEPG